MPQTYQDPGEGLTLPPVREVPVARPLRWLALGWRDFRQVPICSGYHGLAVALGGLVIVWLAVRYWPLLPGAVSGFLLVGPILATGLYALSRRIEMGGRASMTDVKDAWRRGTKPLVMMGLVLAIAATAWVLLSAVLVALFVQVPITGLEGFLRHIVLSKDSHLFTIWVLAGGLGAALVFAITVVSVPLLLDRDIDMLSAIATSVRAVGENPIAMALWATIIMLATVFSMATAMLGFVVTIPVIGHATWHAYRDVVDAETLPLRR
ncbi:MAG: DUF2189 domain-containing protein [Burkholderiales bacterium]|jgi:uncharacterized membrane protein|nr:DUF2189 domain-containing protein [Burkholderiales bacterium]